MRNLLVLTLAITSLSIVTACDACAESVAPAIQPVDVTLVDLKQAIADKKVVLLDANGTASFTAGHIPGAIDFAATTDLAKALPSDKATVIVAYCGGPQCMAWKAAATKATELGYTQVKHFSGGLAGWKAAGETLQVVKPN